VTQAGFRDQLLSRLHRAGASVDAPAADALERYFSLLARWNPKVNLTALPLSPPADETFDRLFVEPVVAAAHIDPAVLGDAPLKWIDLGSGGGSPAIPLKIVRPSWALTMVEAKERKAAFLREATRALRLPDADVANARFEDLDRRPTADVVTVRAVRLDNTVAEAVRNLLNRDGILAVFHSSEASLPGFVVEKAVSLVPESSTVLTLLRGDSDRGRDGAPRVPLR
jgi:16S rRNA (guanine527-N7)-methyltransferase